MSTERQEKHTDDLPSHCLDCETELHGAYCSGCGLHNTHRRLRAPDIVGDVLSHFLTFDSTVFRTLSGLVRNPGRVAREYVDGRRKRYLNPFKLYIALSAIFFLLNRLLDIDLIETVATPAEGTKAAFLVGTVQGFMRAHLDQVVILTLPILAVVLRILFRKSRFNFAETFTFTLFESSLSLLIQIVLAPLALLLPTGFVPARLLIRWATLSWGVTVFYDKRPWKAILLSWMAIASFLMITVLVGISAIVVFVLLRSP